MCFGSDVQLLNLIKINRRSKESVSFSNRSTNIWWGGCCQIKPVRFHSTLISNGITRKKASVQIDCPASRIKKNSNSFYSNFLKFLASRPVLSWLVCTSLPKWVTFTELPDYYNQRHQETLSFILLYDFYVLFFIAGLLFRVFCSLYFLATLPLLTGTWWGPRTWLKTKLKMENFLFQGLGPFPEVEFFFFCCSRWHRFLDFSEVMACNWTLGCHRGEIYHRGHKDESSESYKFSTLKLCIKTVLVSSVEFEIMRSFERTSGWILPALTLKLYLKSHITKCVSL